MACLSCNLARQKYEPPSRNRHIVECAYSLEELRELENRITSNFLRSQIAIYNIDCNRYKKQIDELFKRL